MGRGREGREGGGEWETEREGKWEGRRRAGRIKHQELARASIFRGVYEYG